MFFFSRIKFIKQMIYHIYPSVEEFLQSTMVGTNDGGGGYHYPLPYSCHRTTVVGHNQN
jgi:hypothetical protein